MQFVHPGTDRAVIALLATALCLTISLVVVSAAKSAAHAESRAIERSLQCSGDVGIAWFAHNRAALAHGEAVW
ncbi:hypothetical protein [Methylobacterium nigriterrae]|uniref:hypothetical protein n=1 Tax=Methylobacterium nigriterrae TaxID=3127512 RepID=UPI003013A2AE